MTRWSVLAVGLGGLGLSCVGSLAATTDSQTIIHRATVTLVPDVCAGVIVGDARHALTAAHCVADPSARTGITLYNGQQISGAFEVVDRSRDMALIRLDHPAPVRPLQITDQPAEAGQAVLFTSRMEHPGEPQWAAVERLGHCPSLPDVPAALFTTLRGKPGDSGGPVVDPNLNVVGLVHGGARCSIAAPTADFAPTLAQAVRDDGSSPSG
jgi:S1-C subfamily serine protease